MSTSGWYAHIRYSAEGMPVHIQYKNGSNKADEYYYMFNAQGDVVGLLDGTGKLVVEYTYDAWGQPLTITGSMKDTLGKANPLRYRCYVYDEETGMYYLGSRYYNPVMGRFINSDGTDVLLEDYEQLQQYNLFVYCFNNPINLQDPDGRFALALAITAAAWKMLADVAVAVIGVVATVAVVSYAAKSVYNFSHSRSKRKSGREGLKKQGREDLEKKKQNGDWKQNSGKKKRSQPRPHHPSKRGHRKY